MKVKTPYLDALREEQRASFGNNSSPRLDREGMAALLTTLGFDAATGDGLLDQIPPNMLAATADLMGDRADTYAEVREMLLDKWGQGGAHFDGWVNFVKGRIGEQTFIDQYGDGFKLALSKNQEAIDAWRVLSDGAAEAVQIKMYSNPDAVIDHMLKVQQKVADGLPIEGHSISKLDFAVPRDIADAVKEKMAAYPQLHGVEVLPVETTAADLAGIVREAGEAAADPLANALDTMFVGTGLSLAIEAAINAVQVARGKKTSTAAANDMLVSVPVTATAVGAAKVSAALLVKLGAASNPVVLPIVTAVVVRKVGKSWFDVRKALRAQMRAQSLIQSFIVDGACRRLA